jgi:hypothetical protein
MDSELLTRTNPQKAAEKANRATASPVSKIFIPDRE